MGSKIESVGRRKGNANVREGGGTRMLGKMRLPQLVLRTPLQVFRLWSRDHDLLVLYLGIRHGHLRHH